MKFPLTLLISLSCAASADPASDMLRFKKGDTLHGRYLGLDEGPLVQWQSAEAEESIAFETRNLRKISFNGGRAKAPVTSQGVVNMVGGDVIPGRIISMGGDSITIQTEYAGLLTVAREQVLSLQPNRNGGNVLYAGPFSVQDWQVLHPRVQPASPETKGEQNAEPEQPAAWTYGGSAWYSEGSFPLRLDVPLPSKASIRFHMAWKNRLNVDFALLADFMIPQDEPAEDEKTEEEAEDAAEDPKDQAGVEAQPRARRIRLDKPPVLAGGDLREIGVAGTDSERYGSSYVLSLQSNYARLQRLTFNEKNQPQKISFRTSNGSNQLQNTYEADFEIRLDRESGHLSLFVDGAFYGEWQDPEPTLDDAPRFFAIEAQQQSLIRISDIAVAEWNGMPDSARSMQNDDRDILLLTNGTDRLSGKILSMEEDVFQVEADYATFQIPITQVADIRLASKGQGTAREPEDGEIALSLQPYGRLTLLPHESTSGRIRGRHTIFGELDLNLDYCYLIEFDPDATIFDNWDDDF